ncbi:MAG TPA: SDR family NAD(P)-dependent oxidoreductase, partial [Propionibacteriaceae bacterium]
MSTFPDDRTVIVTGAVSPRGIGRATADLLAARGWHVGIIDLDEGGCKALAAELAEKHGVQAFGAAADVSDEFLVRAAVDQIEDNLPQVVALANIAGVSSSAGYLELTSDEWHRVININLNGVHYVTRRVAESMVQHGVGRIVSLSSVSAQRGGGTFSKTP